ncbi:MAG: hypothetical protein F8N36_06755 [Desulfovibrio sp.]|nr:hypothetical protein [Desulfovibrio sp.]
MCWRLWTKTTRPCASCARKMYCGRACTTGR